MNPNTARRCVVSIAAMLGVCAALVACGAGSTSQTAPTVPVRSDATATVSGTFVTVGGPATQSGRGGSRDGRNGVIALYVRMSHDRPMGSPVAITHSRAADGGRFSVVVPPGTYYVVATNERGKPIFDTARTSVAAGDAKTVALEFVVP